jgi:hypothetical protein
MPRLKQLSPRHKRFCELYTDPQSECFGNVSKSYIAAGFTDNKAGIKNACKLLQMQCVKDELERIVREREKKELVDRDWVDQKLRLVYEKAMEKGDYASAIRCLELLGKARSMFSENINTNVQQLKEIDDTAKEEALRLANIRLKQA